MLAPLVESWGVFVSIAVIRGKNDEACRYRLRSRWQVSLCHDGRASSWSSGEDGVRLTFCWETQGKLVLPGEQKDPTLTMESTQAKMATDPLTPYDQLLAPPLHGLDHGATLLDRDRSGLFTGCAAVVV